MLRVYLDNCCFNRPFDDQGQARIRSEAEAKLEVQRRIRSEQLELAWSYILDFENRANPFIERQEAISRWRPIAAVDVVETTALLDSANELGLLGLRPKDSLHIACAISAHCEFFLTTDDQILKRTIGLATIRSMNPIEFLAEVKL